MWRDSTGVGHDTWKSCALAEATRQLIVWLPDIPDRQLVAEEMARLVYVAKDAEACAAWGALYQISETEPAYDAAGNEIQPRQYQPITHDPTMPKFIQEKPPRFSLRAIMGGKQ
jgi:hypothetical protein